MRRLLVVLAAATLIGALLAPAAASAKKPHVFSPAAHPFGASLEEWQARWFKWFRHRRVRSSTRRRAVRD
jgi:hypothetical protein